MYKRQVYELDAAERAAALAGIERAASSGKLISTIGKTFALSDIATAHETVERGSVIGNVVVKLS